ncbi:MAG TPA: LON peptidase substrate-binding domain-containing protein [Longimicrobiaceae bacterium]
MERLPLFPLPIVLLPGAPMPLHIFEPRYRQMVARCVEGDGRFGLVYHDPDREGPFHADEARVGTVARITRYEPLPDGRSLIMCRGEERFVIREEVEGGAPYYEAVVTPYEDEAAPDPRLPARRRQTIALFHRVLREAMSSPPPHPHLDPGREVAFRVAHTIRIDPAWQQRLLETRSERERLEQIDELLRSVLEAHARGEWSPQPEEEE